MKLWAGFAAICRVSPWRHLVVLTDGDNCWRHEALPPNLLPRPLTYFPAPFLINIQVGFWSLGQVRSEVTDRNLQWVYGSRGTAIHLSFPPRTWFCSTLVLLLKQSRTSWSFQQCDQWNQSSCRPKADLEKPHVVLQTHTHTHIHTFKHTNSHHILSIGTLLPPAEKNKTFRKMRSFFSSSTATEQVFQP